MCACVRASVECNKRRSYSVRGRGEEEVQFEKKQQQKKKHEDTNQLEEDILEKDSSSSPFLSRDFQHKFAMILEASRLALAPIYVFLVRVNVYQDSLTVHASAIASEARSEACACL